MEDSAEHEALRKKLGAGKPASTSSASGAIMDVEKSDRELQRLAATKYGKSRPAPGTAEDTVFGVPPS